MNASNFLKTVNNILIQNTSIVWYNKQHEMKILIQYILCTDIIIIILWNEVEQDW